MCVPKKKVYYFGKNITRINFFAKHSISKITALPRENNIYVLKVA